MPLPRMTFYSNWASGIGLFLLGLILLPLIAGGLIWIGVVSFPILIFGSLFICIVILSAVYFFIIIALLCSASITEKKPPPAVFKVLEPENAAKIILCISVTTVCILIFSVSGLWGLPLIIFIAYLCLY